MAGSCVVGGGGGGAAEMAEVTALADLPDTGAVHLLFYLVAHLLLSTLWC